MKTTRLLESRIILKKSSFFILLIIHAFIAKSQDYTPFDFAHGEWYCRYFTKGSAFMAGPGTEYCTDTVRFFCQGDTLINGTDFHKLYYEGFTSYYGVSRKYISGYYGSIRNDTANRKVWFGNSVLYDFNMKEGDSLCYNPEFGLFMGEGECYKVLGVDSLAYCNHYHKRYTLVDTTGYIHTLIEGIGSTFGLLPIDPRNMFYQETLLCYSERGNEVCSSCEALFSGINPEVGQVSGLAIRLSDHHIHIASELIVHSVEITDMSGRPIYFNPRVNSGQISIPVSPTGIYIVRIRIGNDYIVRKISTY